MSIRVCGIRTDRHEYFDIIETLACKIGECFSIPKKLHISKELNKAIGDWANARGFAELCPKPFYLQSFDSSMGNILVSVDDDLPSDSLEIYGEKDWEIVVGRIVVDGIDALKDNPEIMRKAQAYLDMGNSSEEEDDDCGFDSVGKN